MRHTPSSYSRSARTAVVACALLSLASCSDEPEQQPTTASTSGSAAGTGASGGDGTGGDGGQGGEVGGAGASTQVAWTQIPNPTDAPIDRVAGSAPDDVWVLGPISAAHFDGAEWKSVGSVGDVVLVDVWSSGPGDARILVDDPVTVYKWTGGPLPLDVQWVGLQKGFAVVGSAADDIWVGTEWALGHANVHHWNGADWSDVGTGDHEAAVDLWSTSATDAWAVLATTPQGTPPSTEKLAHYDGRAWSAEEQAGVIAVWASGPSDAWAVGKPGYSLHHDGSGWIEYAAGTTEILRAVWGSGPSDVWAVGDDAVVHWDGKEWQTPAGAPPGGVDVWGSSATDVWIVSSDGNTLHHLAPQ